MFTCTLCSHLAAVNTLSGIEKSFKLLPFPQFLSQAAPIFVSIATLMQKYMEIVEPQNNELSNVAK